MPRKRLLAAVGLLGLGLTLVLLINAVHDRDALGYAKSALAAAVTWRLCSALRTHEQPSSSPTDAAAGKRTARLIAIGLAIGLGAPFAGLWLLKAFSG